MDFAYEPTFFFLAKIGLLIFLLIYMIFAIIVVRQVRLMTDTLDLGFETPIKFISFLHLIFSFLTFLAALLIL
jgi:hypothetical protein